MLRLAAFAVTSALATAAVGPLPPLPLGRLLATPDRLTMTMADTGNRQLDREYRLECDPAGGDHPEAEAPAPGWTSSPGRAGTPSPPSPRTGSARSSTEGRRPRASPERGTGRR